jgi:hypothetical protein
MLILTVFALTVPGCKEKKQAQAPRDKAAARDTDDTRSKRKTDKTARAGGPAAAGGDTAHAGSGSARKGGKIMSLNVESKAFEPQQAIAQKYAYKGEGQNISPPLSWSGAPQGVASYVVIVDDPDAPSPKNPRPKPWVHWVLYNIPPQTTALAEGATGGGVQGKTDFGETAYGGPMPPPGSGTHRYFFKVHALDTTLDLEPGATKDQVLDAMEGHVLAKGEIYGTYERKK